VAAPVEAAAQEGGSLKDTFIVPMLGVCIVDVPPLQLIMMAATIAAATVTTTGIVRCFNWRSTIDFTAAS